jgi:serine/threonine-protein kinase
MTLGSSTRTRWIARVLGFAGVAGSPDEARAFLQRRIALYVGLVSAFWFGAWLLNAITGAVLGDWLPATTALRGAVAAHLGFAGIAGLAWWVLRRGRPSIPVLGTADAVTTVLQGTMLGAMVALLEPSMLSETGALLALSHVLVGRAAIVPSRGARSVTVGVLACAPFVVGAAIQASMTSPQGLSSWQTALTTVPWCIVAVLTSSVISFVIYGLQQRAKAAQQLGQYTLEHKLGQGGMGVVYRARHAMLRRPTAIKLLAPDRTEGTDLARFEREVQLTSQLTHPNTIAIYDYGRTPGGVFYYAMEYLDGLDLESLVKADGPQPSGRVVHILHQAAGALAEAHHVGLIHRDVKPANLLLCRRGLLDDVVKVLDFGLVRELGGDTELSTTGMLLGTPLYLAPESIRTPDRIDGRADLYALGAVGFFLLTGRPPFDGESVVEVCRKHLDERVPSLSSVLGTSTCPVLERIIMSCLEKDPERRPEARALLEELEGCRGQLPWSNDDARAWWEHRGNALWDQRMSQLPRIQEASTLAVDLGNRIQT